MVLNSHYLLKHNGNIHAEQGQILLIVSAKIFLDQMQISIGTQIKRLKLQNQLAAIRLTHGAFMICMAMYGRKLLLYIKPLKATLKNYSLEEVGLGGAHLKTFVPHDDFHTKKIFVLWILVSGFV